VAVVAVGVAAATTVLAGVPAAIMAGAVVIDGGRIVPGAGAGAAGAGSLCQNNPPLQKGCHDVTQKRPRNRAVYNVLRSVGRALYSKVGVSFKAGERCLEA
jgi:hypothetical protein